jgi:predicted ATPase
LWGLLDEQGDQYALRGPLPPLAIPTTLQDSLTARLDGRESAKAVAQYASVIGRQFSYALLRVVSSLDEATLQHELDRLVAAELLYQRGLSPQATYTFKHALIQDSAYQSLLRSTKQKYHQRPALQPFGRVLRRVRPDAAEFERRAVLVQRDQRFLRVRGEGMTVERKRHRGTFPYTTCSLQVVEF